jgi:hypothetical protein
MSLLKIVVLVVVFFDKNLFYNSVLLIRHIIDNNIDYPKDHKRILFYQTMRNAQSHMNIFDNMPKVGSQQLYGRY